MAGLCDVCKMMGEMGMPCHPRSCQCTCHRRSRIALANKMKQDGITSQKIAEQIRAGEGLGFYSMRQDMKKKQTQSNY